MIHFSAMQEDSTRQNTIVGKPSGPTTAGKSQHTGNHRTRKRAGHARKDHVKDHRLRLFDAAKQTVAGEHLTKDFLLLDDLA
ncbi:MULTISPECIES: hypothetical protein [Ochrobactrum]|uniref:Uncharacterized protein n=1 Tax=Ochrobactrum quorumnocens TaxID=271865 RepID=A0A5N1K1D2_9HYPH|nr:MULTISPECIES: hypothetical protein [Brucella/Ochrobactrum group]KAA9367275.1 hypothetical protein F3W84_14230 [[Ochrobactrum] quorumnocens]MBD7992104.1 hypothetical protein [Ochrobactrum gallinarum]MDH7793376.1 hypothetical protein [Ochrobactrum sp. AN78]